MLEQPGPQDVVIVGASGDLARKKLLPALYNLAVDGLLPVRGKVIGTALDDMDSEAFRNLVRESVERSSTNGVDDAAWRELSQRLEYVRMDSDGGYGALRTATQEPRRLIYLAVPPMVVSRALHQLHAADLAQGTRVIIEKPFGHDLQSARRLNDEVHRLFDEASVFRIDHYLGKETVQNILVFRFGNLVFERIWNRDAVDHVEITVAESIGVEMRGEYYERSGALRDIVQNHVLQVLALLAMEPPNALTDEAIRDEKGKLLKAVRPLDPAKVLRGQYTAGEIDGATVPGYREEPGIAPDSTTETYFAAEVAIDSWRWAGVPFYIRTGKRLPRRETAVTVGFRDVPLPFFEGTEVAPQLKPNHLVLRIQPDEGITLSFVAKAPGPEIRAQPVHMDFSYRDSFMTHPAEAYERLLHDALDDDRTLFLREDAVERSWAAVQPVLDNPPPVFEYAAGTWGPGQADALIAPRTWHMK